MYIFPQKEIPELFGDTHGRNLRHIKIAIYFAILIKIPLLFKKFKINFLDKIDFVFHIKKKRKVHIVKRKEKE